VLSFKDGVSVRGVRNEITLAIVTAVTIFSEHGYDCVVTSVVDGEHSWGSLHYRGDAVDFRIKHVVTNNGSWDDDKIRKIFEAIKAALPDDYDVVLEDDHIHVEFQPKK
jgi:formylmethanofuran dehydrogenase subunit B